MQAKDKPKTVFSNELKVLERAEQILKNPELTREKLTEEYNWLTQQYHQLLNDAVKITRIGDINQKKLFESHEEIERQKEVLYQLSITDHLTGLYNRTYLNNFLLKEFARSKRYEQPFSCLLFDIDDFKVVNDTHGHLVGDGVLKQISEVGMALLREVDLFFRYGGEEFLIILPETPCADATVAAEKLCKHIAETDFTTPNGSLHITISVGVSDNLIGNPQTETELINNADSALYEAKRDGKNQVVSYSPVQ